MSSLGLVQLTDLPRVFLNEHHYNHSLEFIINNSIGRPLLCYVCVHESLKNTEELSCRKLSILGLIKSLLEHRDNELSERFCLIENKKQAEDFIDTLFELVYVDDNVPLATAAEENLILMVKRFNGRCYYLECYLIDNLMKLFLNTNDSRGLVYLRIIRKLLNIYPRIIDYLIKLSGVTNGNFSKKMVNCLSLVSEEFRENAVPILLKIISHRSSETASFFPGFEYDISKAIIAIFKSSRNENLILSSLSIFKTLACSGYAASEVWFVHGTLPSAITSLIRMPNSVIQANVAQCVAQLLVMASHDRISLHSFLEGDFPGLLFDTLKIPDNILISSVIYCASLLVKHSDFYGQHNCVFWITPVTVAANFCLERKYWDTCNDALNLMSNMIENVSEFDCQISGNVTNLDLYLKLITDGLNCDNILVATSTAYLFTKTLSIRHLPTPIPFTKLNIPIVICLKWLDKGLKHLGSDQSVFVFNKNSQSSPRSHELQRQDFNKLRILFAFLDNLFKLFGACNSNAILAEMTYSVPESNPDLDKEDATSIPLLDYYKMAFYALETLAIPYFCSVSSKVFVPDLILSFLNCLLSAFHADDSNDYEHASNLGPKLISGSFLDFIWLARNYETDSINDYPREKVIEVSQKILKLVFHFVVKIKFRMSNDLPICLNMVDRGVNKLKASFEDSLSCLSLSYHSSYDQECLDIRSSQFLCLLHYYFAIKMDPREAISTCKLRSDVSSYIQSNSHDLHRISVTFQRVLIYLVAVNGKDSTLKYIITTLKTSFKHSKLFKNGFQSYYFKRASFPIQTASTRSLEDTEILFDNHIFEASVSIILKSICTENVRDVLECDKILLTWCFSSPEICERLGQTMVKLWLETSSSNDEGEKLDENSIHLSKILADNKTCQEKLWNVFTWDDEISIKTMVQFLTNLSKVENQIELVGKIGQSLLKVVPNILNKDIKDFAKDYLLTSVVKLRYRYKIMDTIDQELNIIYHVCQIITRKQTSEKSILRTCLKYLTSALDSTHEISNSKRGVAYLVCNCQLFELLQSLITDVDEETLIDAMRLLIRVDSLTRQYHLSVGNLKPIKFEWRICNRWLTVKEDNYNLIKSTLNLFNNYFRSKLSSSVYVIQVNDSEDFWTGFPKIPKDLLATYTRVLDLLAKKNLLYDFDALELFVSMTQYGKMDREVFDYFANNPWLLFLRKLRPDEELLQLNN